MLLKIKKYLISKLNLNNFNTENVSDTEAFNKIALLYFLMFVGLVIQFSFTFISFYKEQYVITVLDIVTSGIIIFLFWHLRKTLNHFFSSSVYVAVLAAFFLYLIVTGGINNQGYIWTFLFPVGVIFFFGHRMGFAISMLFMGISILLLATISTYNSFGIGFIIRYTVAYSSLMMISYFFEVTKNKFNNQLREKNFELEEAIEKVHKADKLKSEFLAQMSHEIRTPINTILNYTYLLKNEFEDKIPEELEGSFNSINNASQRLIRTIDLILDLSAIESGTYEPVYEDIPIASLIIEPLIDEFNHLAELKGLELLFDDKRDSDEPIRIDKYTMTQSLINLIHNALKYTYGGYVKVILEKDIDSTRLVITDTGIGIAPEYLPELFQKFSQESQGYSRRFEGNGLGLALVKEYCTINNAEIQVESEKGVGTTFTITIQPLNSNNS